MIIDLIALQSSPYRFETRFSPEEISLESEGAELAGEAEIKGTLTKRIVQTEIEGYITADINIECSRCLQRIEKSLNFPFNAGYVAPENYSEARETELNEGDLEVALFDGQHIDVKELVREQILLNLPTQIFCSENCKGLCPKCGVNRNLLDCNCEENEIDPRWSVLKNLK